MLNYYELLGVGRAATAAEVRQAYLRLAREKHPDLFADPGEKARAQSFFQDLTTAFNTLHNEGSRREYDAQMDRPKAVTPAEIAQEAYARGLQMLEAGQLEDAVTALHAAVHHAPNEARYHAALGRALARHPPAAREAIQALERAVQLAPGLAPLHAELAALFLKQGLRLRAQKAAEQALRLDPKEPLARRVADNLGPA
jgi:tetratricopeptide (TPR) repeat protein